MRKDLFPGQQDNEIIHLLIREHWFHFLTKLVLWVLFVIVLFAFDKYVPIYVPKLLEEPYIYYVDLFKNIYLMLVVIGLFILWIMYYLNVQIITNERIVDVEQNGIFKHTVSELNLTRIEDVTAETKGLFGTIFTYGNVYVQTAAETERFTFHNIPNPDAVAKKILNLFDELPHMDNKEVGGK